MVITLLFILILVVFLAFFVGNNLSNLCTFWFLKTYTDLPVTILVFFAFGAGIVLSLLCVLFAKLRKSKDDAVEEKHAKLQAKVKKAEEKAKAVEEKAKNMFEKKSKKEKNTDPNKTQEMSASDLQKM